MHKHDFIKLSFDLSQFETQAHDVGKAAAKEHLNNSGNFKSNVDGLHQSETNETGVNGFLQGIRKNVAGKGAELYDKQSPGFLDKYLGSMMLAPSAQGLSDQSGAQITQGKQSITDNLKAQAGKDPIAQLFAGGMSGILNKGLDGGQEAAAEKFGDVKGEGFKNLALTSLGAAGAGLGAYSLYKAYKKRKQGSEQPQEATEPLTKEAFIKAAGRFGSLVGIGSRIRQGASSLNGATGAVKGHLGRNANRYQMGATALGMPLAYGAGSGHGYDNGYGQGYGYGVGMGTNRGYALAQQQAQQTPFFSRLMGNYSYNPGQVDELSQLMLSDPSIAQGARGNWKQRHGVPFA